MLKWTRFVIIFYDKWLSNLVNNVDNCNNIMDTPLLVTKRMGVNNLAGPDSILEGTQQFYKPTQVSHWPVSERLSGIPM